jgi:hypothetical protein
MTVFSMALSGCNIDTNTDKEDGNNNGGQKNNRVLTNIQISMTMQGSSELTLPIGSSQELIAIGTFDDGTRTDITDEVTLHANNNIALSGNARVTGVLQGVSQITATLEGIVSNSLSVSVNVAELKRITIMLANNEASSSRNYLIAGNSQQMIAQGVYADGTSADITEDVTWSTSQGSGEYLTVTSSGLVTGVNQGIVTIRAIADDIDSNSLIFNVSRASLTSIELMSKDPVARDQSEFSLALGNTFQFIALGTYDNGSIVDITDSVISHRYNQGNGVGYKIDVSDKGLVVALNTEGVNRITVSKEGIVSNPLKFTLTSAQLTDIIVTPSSSSISDPVTLVENTETQFVAIGIYSDGMTADITNRVNWGLEFADQIISLSTTGLARGLVSGAAQIYVTLDGIEANTVSVKVISPTLISIAITDDGNELDELSLVVDTRHKLKAIGIYDDGSTRDITDLVFWDWGNWHASFISVYRGSVTGVNTGTDYVTASFNDVSSTQLPVVVMPIP